VTDATAVLFANEAFYRAFAAADLGAMDQVWAREAPVACIHPGWNALAGRRAIMESWAAIFDNPSRPKIRCQSAQAYLLGDAAFVICHEVMEQGFLIATNMFVREVEAWKMVHHQAGPSQSLPPEPAAVPGVMH
jgi:hypothetical protein